MTNLLEETERAIHDMGYRPSDIKFIGSLSSGHRCTWKEFKQLANNEYDAGYGGQKVAEDLTIVFKDMQSMWRAEYDGSEWWDWREPVKIPEARHKITNLFADIGWDCLSDIQSK